MEGSSLSSPVAESASLGARSQGAARRTIISHVGRSLVGKLRIRPGAALKIALSIIMITAIAWFVDLEKLLTLLRNVSPLLLGAIALGYLGTLMLNSFKWWLLARGGGIEVGYLTTLRASFVGAFVNCFGLGLVGGDLARALLIAEGKPVKAQALASVVADRVQGLIVLLAIGVVTSFLVVGPTIDEDLRLLIVGVAVALALVWIFNSTLLTRLIPRGEGRVAKILYSLARAFPHSPRLLLTVSGVSLLFHLAQIALHGLMAYALGLHLGWITLLVSVPFVNILSNLPLSWNGLGVRENAYAFFLAGHLTGAHAIAMGALWLFAVTTTSAVGGLLAVLTGDLGKLAQMRQEERLRNREQLKDVVAREAHADL